MPFDYKALCASWKWNIPRKFNAGVDCADRNASNPDLANRTALIWEGGDGEVKRFSFSDLKTETNKIANIFLASGVKRGDRVMVMLDNVPEFPFSFLAAMKIGAIPIPASAMLTRHEVSHILADSGAKALVTSPEIYGRVGEAAAGLSAVWTTGGKAPAGCADIDSLTENAPAELTPANTSAEDIAYLCYTSGTTGEPKGVAHAHRAVIGRDPAAVFWLGARSRPRVFHAGKLNWTYTLGAGCLDAWRHGCSSVIYGGAYNPRIMFDLIKKHRVDVFMAVPTVFRQMARDAADGAPPDVSGLAHCLSAGEHLTPELFSIWKDNFGVDIREGLGMSEFSYYISNMEGMSIKPGSPGMPQPGRKCFLADPESGEPVRGGGEGVLCSSPGDPGIMLGYWNRPAETREMFSRKGDFISGDYFTADDEGYLWPLGRKDDMINSFGYRISPFEIEAALSKHPKVADCAAAGIEAGEGKVIAAAFVVPSPGGHDGETLKKEILDFLSARLAHYKIPKEVFITGAIPRTKNGKKKRGELRGLHGGAAV